jgi:1,4-dihydroxy-2-naphthoate polyprenyltransferase
LSGPATSKPAAWLRVARLQFFPVVFFVFGAGAIAASLRTGVFEWTRFISAYLCLFLIELATILTNEHFDYQSDARNKNAGPFTGGSRMIVRGVLSHDEVLRAVTFAVIALGAVSGVLLSQTPREQHWPTFVLTVLGVVLGLGYTAPPLKLSYRGYGEITVAFTHGTYAMLFGWVTQGGDWRNPLPYLLSMPVFCAVLATNTLAGIPDRAADASVGKRSYGVIFGPASAAIIAALAALAASAAGVTLWSDGIVPGRFGLVFWLTVPHALALAVVLARFARSGRFDRRIDAILVNALSFILWFALIPFAYFLWRVRGHL